MKYPSGLRALVLAAALATPLAAGTREFTTITYNVENLFDADRVAIFEDYAETGEPNGYSPAKLLEKIRTIAKVLKTINHGSGPEIAGLNEIEMDFTPESKVADYPALLEKYKGTTVDKMLTTELNDEIRGLPSEAFLLKYFEDNGLKGYQVAIGQDQPDFAALASTDPKIHKKGQKNVLFTKFPILETKSHATPDARDILEVKLDVDGHPLTVFVNHWKSGAGNPASEPARRLNAKTLRDRLDQILAADPSADVLLVGDFNSQYNQTQAYPFMGQTGVNDVLGSQGDEKKTATATGFSLYNLWYELPREQRGSDEFDGEWGTLMQDMITPGLYDYFGVQYVDNSFRVVRVEGVNTRTDLQLPRRWSNYGSGSGASDHLPVSARFRTVEDSDKTRRLELVKPGIEDGSTEPVKVGFDKIKPDRLPVFTKQIADTASTHMGEIFKVRGKITARRPLTLQVEGQDYLLWGQNGELGKRMRAYPKDSSVELLGELNLHEGKLQFVVGDASWLLHEPKPEKGGG
ncbi:MAG: endonuclease/exonuclease/phosphatase family protein [Chthoniobacterales bacterium]